MQPYVFHNGFVANRIARHEQDAYPDRPLQVVKIKQGRAGRAFLIERDANEYWVSFRVYAPLPEGMEKPEALYGDPS